jgi:heme/copper-type cytochrome/quinol oxidase subunit 2
MNKKLISASVLTALLSAPAMILAFNPGGVPNAAPGLTINTMVDIIFGILWPVAVAFFIIMFVIAAFHFFTAGGDETKLQQARMEIVWGVAGVIIALLAFSIPFIVRNTLGQGI